MNSLCGEEEEEEEAAAAVVAAIASWNRWTRVVVFAAVSSVKISESGYMQCNKYKERVNHDRYCSIRNHTHLHNNLLFADRLRGIASQSSRSLHDLRHITKQRPSVQCKAAWVRDRVQNVAFKYVGHMLVEPFHVVADGISDDFDILFFELLSSGPLVRDPGERSDGGNLARGHFWCCKKKGLKSKQARPPLFLAPPSNKKYEGRCLTEQKKKENPKTQRKRRKPSKKKRNVLDDG